jgi:hypothetical protein
VPFSSRNRARAAELLTPENLPPAFLSYMADYITLNQPPLTSGQIIGAASYARQIDLSATQLNIVSSASEETLYSYTLGGGTLGSQGCVRLLLTCDYLNNTGLSNSFTLRVKYGATTMFAGSTGALSFLTSTSRRAIRIICELSGAASQSSQNLAGFFAINIVVPPTTGIGSIADAAAYVSPFAGVASESSTVNKAITVTVQHSASNANLSLRRNYALLTKIGH